MPPHVHIGQLSLGDRAPGPAAHPPLPERLRRIRPVITTDRRRGPERTSADQVRTAPRPACRGRPPGAAAGQVRDGGASRAWLRGISEFSGGRAAGAEAQAEQAGMRDPDGGSGRRWLATRQCATGSRPRCGGRQADRQHRSGWQTRSVSGASAIGWRSATGAAERCPTARHGNSRDGLLLTVRQLDRRLTPRRTQFGSQPACDEQDLADGWRCGRHNSAPSGQRADRASQPATRRTPPNSRPARCPRNPASNRPRGGHHAQATQQHGKRNFTN